MSEQYGILLVSHVAELADGLTRLLKQVAKDVTVKAVGGAEDGGIGTSFGAYLAAALLQADTPYEKICEQLQELYVK